MSKKCLHASSLGLQPEGSTLMKQNHETFLYEDLDADGVQLSCENVSSEDIIPEK
jgi:hypothetical protein